MHNSYDSNRIQRNSYAQDTGYRIQDTGQRNSATATLITAMQQRQQQRTTATAIAIHSQSYSDSA